jgi:hypothetical protein
MYAGFVNVNTNFRGSEVGKRTGATFLEIPPALPMGRYHGYINSYLSFKYCILTGLQFVSFGVHTNVEMDALVIVAFVVM